MKGYLLLLSLLFSLNAAALEKLNVQLWAERDLISKDDKYILQLHSGTWRSGAILYWVGTSESINFDGTQKGLSFILNSFVPGAGIKQPEYKITGQLAPHLNHFEAELHHLPSKIIEKATFGPLFWKPDFPQHYIEFWGEPQPYNRVQIQEIRVIERTSDQLLQRITVAHTNDIYVEGLAAHYVDLNFDGYFDLAMQIGGDFEAGGYRYWLYNPKNRQFEFSEELSKLTRYPSRDIIRREIQFLEGRYRFETAN